MVSAPGAEAAVSSDTKLAEDLLDFRRRRKFYKIGDDCCDDVVHSQPYTFRICAA